MSIFPARVFPRAAVNSASTVPAYALVFINLIIVFAVTTQVTLAAAIIVDGTVLVLSVYAIWVVELRSNRSVSTTTATQAQRLAGIRDLDSPIRSVFEGMVDNNSDVYVVYSSTEVTEFVDQLGATVRPDQPIFGSRIEKRVTTIPDAVGASSIHKLLFLGGKRNRLNSITSWKDDFRPEYWDANLVLIGSGKSNRITPMVLDSFKSPYIFSVDNNTIIDRSSPDDIWPKQIEDLKSRDYGIVAKFSIQREDLTSTQFVIAGLGPYGTLAGCLFLEQNITKIYEEYGSSPFAYIVSIKRDNLGSIAPTVERQCALPIVRS